MKISNIWLIFFNELFVVARSVSFDSHSPLIAIRSQHLFFIKKHYNFSKLFLNHAWRYHQCLMIPILCHYLFAHREYAYFFIMFVQIWKFFVCFHLGISILSRHSHWGRILVKLLNFLALTRQVSFSDSSHHQFTTLVTSWKSPFEIWNIFHFFESSSPTISTQLNLFSTPCHLSDSLRRLETFFSSIVTDSSLRFINVLWFHTFSNYSLKKERWARKNQK